MVNKLLLILVLLIVVFIPSISQSRHNETQRIVSLAPSTTEILFSLGLDREIVAVTNFCNYPPQVKNKQKIGTFSQPDIEKILFIKPDIIFATGLEQAITVERLRKLGLKVYVSNPSNLQELYASIREMGKFTHREKEAGALIKKMETKISQISARVKAVSRDRRPKVFVEIWHDPLMTAGKDSFIDELISLAGCVNIANDAPKAYSYFSPELLIERDPDFIILGHKTKGALNIFRKQLGYKDIKAVKNNRVSNDINPDLFLRPGPRIVEGLQEIYQRVYSD